MQIISFDASFNSHQHVLLSGRPVSHGQLLLSHNVLRLWQLDLMEETTRSKIRDKEEKSLGPFQRKEKILNSVFTVKAS